MSLENNIDHQPPHEQPKELQPQQIVEAALKLAVVAIEAADDQEERTAMIDTVKAELGSTGLIVHDLEEGPADERRGKSGLTRDQIIMMRRVRGVKRTVRPSQLGWKT